MARLPVIVGFGGINSAGRSSGHHAYRRLVIDALSQNSADETLRNLAPLMGLDAPMSDAVRQQILGGTLVRKIDESLFDSSQIPWNKKLAASSGEDVIQFFTSRRNLPEQLPENWTVTPVDNRSVRVEIIGDTDFLIPTYRDGAVKSGGQLPTGFDPNKLYQSRNHPRGLAMSIFGASDALGSMGIDWSVVTGAVAPDQISVYAGSGMSQLDLNGNGGMMMSRYNGKRVTSKQCPFGFAEMPADFINAYVLGSLGNTGTNMGACASFLYNLRQGIMDIQTGKARVAIVGNAEAPIVPEVMEGYAAMGALATDKELMALDGSDSPDHRRACRPFSSNCGFTIAESAQFMVLFDDELALQLGANVMGAVTDVFVNADGHKKSISAPGVGNYLTVAKAVAAAKAILGEEAVQQRTFIQAHGTGTPQNRVTESHILNETAKLFGIERWPVAAVKAYLGHSIGVAAGDQIMATLGVWEYGLLPGIATIDHIADDVYQSHLQLGSEHIEVGAKGMDAAIINAKGFGGNNASATLLAPHVAAAMLEKLHGKQAYAAYQERQEGVKERIAAYNGLTESGEAEPIYKFDHNVLGGEDLSMSAQSIGVPGFGVEVDLEIDSPYKGLL